MMCLNIMAVLWMCFQTAAFMFPIISGILQRGLQSSGRARKAFPLALVLSPTRELASQIHEEGRKFTYQTGLRPVVVYGGQDTRREDPGRRVHLDAQCCWMLNVESSCLSNSSYGALHPLDSSLNVPWM
jgi:hypothetical protein